MPPAVLCARHLACLHGLTRFARPLPEQSYNYDKPGTSRDPLVPIGHFVNSERCCCHHDAVWGQAGCSLLWWPP